MLSNERIVEIAEGMPGGLDGFLKGWGWQQFARAVEADAIEALEREITRMRGWISVAQAELDGVEIAHDNNCLSAAQGALKRALAPAIQHEGASNEPAS